MRHNSETFLKHHLTSLEEVDLCFAMFEEWRVKSHTIYSQDKDTIQFIEALFRDLRKHFTAAQKIEILNF